MKNFIIIIFISFFVFKNSSQAQGIEILSGDSCFFYTSINTQDSIIIEILNNVNAEQIITFENIVSLFLFPIMKFRFQL